MTEAVDWAASALDGSALKTPDGADGETVDDAPAVAVGAAAAAVSAAAAALAARCALRRLISSWMSSARTAKYERMPAMAARVMTSACQDGAPRRESP